MSQSLSQEFRDVWKSRGFARSLHEGRHINSKSFDKKSEKNFYFQIFSLVVMWLSQCQDVLSSTTHERNINERHH